MNKKLDVETIKMIVAYKKPVKPAPKRKKGVADKKSQYIDFETSTTYVVKDWK